MTPEERVALALAALAEVTDPNDVGPLLSAEAVEPGVIDLRFASTLPGYLDWLWTVSTSDLPDVEPTVLEVELLPGEGSLVAPAWVPWADRLAEWRRQHPADAPADDAEGDEDDEASDEDDELDADELDDDVDEDLLEGADVDPDAADDDPDAADDDSDDDDSDDDDSDAADDDDSDDEDDDLDEDADDGFDRGPRPADEDRSL